MLGGRSAAGRLAAARRGFVRARFTAASTIAPARRATLMRIATPYDVCQSDASVGRCRIDPQTPDAIRTITERNAIRENRGTTVARAGVRRSEPRLTQRTRSPISPPIQIEPDVRWSQSSVSERPRGAVWPAWPERPGITSAAAAAASAPISASISAMERCRRSGRSTRIAIVPAIVKRRTVSSRSR